MTTLIKNLSKIVSRSCVTHYYIYLTYHLHVGNLQTAQKQEKSHQYIKLVTTVTSRITDQYLYFRVFLRYSNVVYMIEYIRTYKKLKFFTTNNSSSKQSTLPIMLSFKCQIKFMKILKKINIRQVFLLTSHKPSILSIIKNS